MFFWFRLLLWLVANRARQYIAGLFVRPRARVHWIGKRTRHARPERAFIALTFVSAIILLKPYEYAVWAAVLGGTTSILLTAISVYRLLPLYKRARK